MSDKKRLPARFFESDSGRMPVRDWLLDLSDDDRKQVGDDIRTAEFGWPIGWLAYWYAVVPCNEQSQGALGSEDKSEKR